MQLGHTAIENGDRGSSLSKESYSINSNNQALANNQNEMVRIDLGIVGFPKRQNTYFQNRDYSNLDLEAKDQNYQSPKDQSSYDLQPYLIPDQDNISEKIYMKRRILMKEKNDRQKSTHFSIHNHSFRSQESGTKNQKPRVSIIRQQDDDTKSIKRLPKRVKLGKRPSEMIYNENFSKTSKMIIKPLMMEREQLSENKINRKKRQLLQSQESITTIDGIISKTFQKEFMNPQKKNKSPSVTQQLTQLSPYARDFVMTKVKSKSSEKSSNKKKDRVQVKIISDGISSKEIQKKREYQEIGGHLIESPDSNRNDNIITDMMSPLMNKRCSILMKFQSKKNIVAKGLNNQKQHIQRMQKSQTFVSEKIQQNREIEIISPITVKGNRALEIQKSDVKNADLYIQELIGSISVSPERKSQYSKISGSSKQKDETSQSPYHQSSQLNLVNKSLLEESPLKVSQYKQVTLDMFRQICLIKQLMQDNEYYQPLSPEQKINFQFKKKGFKKLLIFDLDETLIHVKQNQGVNDDQNNAQDDQDFEPDVDLPVYDPKTGKIITIANFSVRPYTKECLQFANKYFEVAIFTAGKEYFADPIINYLDPTGQLIQHRYFRQHTSQLGGPQYEDDDEDTPFVTVKDLDILIGGGALTLDDILIVDNNIYSFAFNLENGIPIHNFMGDKTDTALKQVCIYLNYIKDFDNIRIENENIHKFQELYNSPIEEWIDHYDSDMTSSDSDEQDFDVDGVTAHNRSNNNIEAEPGSIDAQEIDQRSFISSKLGINQSEIGYNNAFKHPIIISPTYHNVMIDFPNTKNQGYMNDQQTIRYTPGNLSPNPHQQHITSQSEKKTNSKTQQMVQIKLESLANMKVKETSLNTFDDENSMSQQSGIHDLNSKSIHHLQTNFANKMTAQQNSLTVDNLQKLIQTDIITKNPNDKTLVQITDLNHRDIQNNDVLFENTNKSHRIEPYQEELSHLNLPEQKQNEKQIEESGSSGGTSSVELVKGKKKRASLQVKSITNQQIMVQSFDVNINQQVKQDQKFQYEKVEDSDECSLFQNEQDEKSYHHVNDSIINDSEFPGNVVLKPSDLSILNFGSDEFKIQNRKDDEDIQSQKEYVISENSPEPKLTEEINISKKDHHRNLKLQNTELPKKIEKQVEQFLIQSDSPQLEKNNSKLRRQKTQKLVNKSPHAIKQKQDGKDKVSKQIREKINQSSAFFRAESYLQQMQSEQKINRKGSIEKAQYKTYSTRKYTEYSNLKTQGTLLPPRWDIRKIKLEKKRQNLNNPSLKYKVQSSPEQKNKIEKIKTVMAAKNIDSNLDKFSTKMEEYWKSGAIKNALKTQSCSKFIIGKTPVKKQQTEIKIIQKQLQTKSVTQQLKFSTPSVSIEKMHEKRKQMFSEVNQQSLKNTPKHSTLKNSEKQLTRNLTIEKIKSQAVTIQRSQIQQNSINQVLDFSDEKQAIQDFYQNHYSEDKDFFDFSSDVNQCSNWKSKTGNRSINYTTLNSPQSVWHNQRLSDLRNKTKMSFLETKNLYSKSVIEKTQNY